MASYTRQDLLLSDDGDLVVASDGDLAVADIDQTSRQDILINTYTPMGDADAFPMRGSLLYKFVGEPNSRENASLIKSEMIRCLTQSGAFSKEDISIRAIPISIYNLAIYLTLTNSAGLEAQSVVFDYNYTSGPKVVES